jgi:hypothetical protein
LAIVADIQLAASNHDLRECRPNGLERKYSFDIPTPGRVPPQERSRVFHLHALHRRRPLNERRQFHIAAQEQLVDR